jgi:hypothetical protein
VLKAWKSTLLAMSILGFSSSADMLNNLEIYSRCYIRMVRDVPDPVNDPIYRSVAAGKTKGPDGCSQLFDLAAFNSSGVLVNRRNPIARRILKTFNDYHRTWLQARTPTTFTNGSLLITDQEEAPLYYTRALFSKDPFRSVVTLNTGLTGVRDQILNGPPTTSFLAQRLVRYTETAPFANSRDLILQYRHTTLESDRFVSRVNSLTVPNDSVVQSGELVGVRVQPTISLPSVLLTDSIVVDPSIAPYRSRLLVTSFVINRHFGGGILGSQGFLNANFNLARGGLANDVEIINRRVTSRIYSDILCQQQPTLTEADVASEYQSYVDRRSPYPFQTSKSCLRCHSSNDNAAFVLNHLFTFYGGGPLTQDYGLRFYTIGALPTLSSQVGTAPIPFAFRPTQSLGAFLHYRENLSKSSSPAIKQPVNSLADIGAKLATGNDLYLCAVKRYYKFFTGIDVDLTAKATKKIDIAHQNFVIKLGQELRSSQSARKILGEIFKSAPFATRNYATSEAQ